MTLSLALSVARRTVEFDRRLRAGETIPSAYNLGLSLFNKTIGLVGMGDIAREVALKFSLAFSCKIIIYSPTSPAARWTTSSTVPSEPVIPHTRVATLDELLEQSDVVSLHCPELPETRNMMGQAQFAKMKQSAIFLNLGRGGLVDEDALYEACKNRRIFGAGMLYVLHSSGV
jgi:phosphoglycerate dehydrogenase-like enzyme